MNDGEVAPAVRRVVERALALAANGSWNDADLETVLDELRPLRATAAATIELGDSDGPHATIFPLPRGAVIPLHDHPSMTVISKVLHGRMRIESFEWIDAGSGEARSLGARDVDESSEPMVFGPQPGMLHRIAALSDCTFLDLFAP